MDYLKKLNEIEKEVKEADLEKARTEERLKNLKQEQEELLSGIENEGFSEDELEEDINKLQKKIESEIAKCEQILNF
jgi:chromosome segregation ATPase